MRLINTHTFEFEEHFNPEPYAILSHTWRNGEEVTFTDYTNQKGREKAGYSKIDLVCKQARKDELNYAWIDTCCIDKSSSAELSEAINSMYAWYKEAKVCYVYLEDARSVADIQHCRWLSRGWTLQELIAPADVRFYGIGWVALGTKEQLLVELVEWTNIDQIVLEHASSLGGISAANRMSWASSRQTTRIEDVAYCMLGIFGLNMPLLYGEGDRAFIRLQEEIWKQRGDDSILAFDRRRFDRGEVFARSPKDFSHARKILSCSGERTHVEVSSTKLTLRANLYRDPKGREDLDGKYFYAVLQCRYQFDRNHRIALRISPCLGSSKGREYFLATRPPIVIHKDKLQRKNWQVFSLARRPRPNLEPFEEWTRDHICQLRAETLVRHGYEVIYAKPMTGLKSWDEKNLCSEIETFHMPILRKFAFVHSHHHEAFRISLFMPKEYETSGKMWISVKVKPKHLDCKSWLEEENMHSILQPSREHREPVWGGMASPRLVAGDLWVPFDSSLCTGPEDGDMYPVVGLGPNNETNLMSGECFGKVAISIRANGLEVFELTVIPVGGCHTDISNNSKLHVVTGPRGTKRARQPIAGKASHRRKTTIARQRRITKLKNKV